MIVMTEYEKSDLVEELKKAYTDELESMNNYLSIGEYLEGPVGQGIIGEDLLEDVDEELNHAEELARRLTELGEKPPSSVDYNPSQQVVSKVEEETDVREAVEIVVQLEKDAVSRYEKIIEIAEHLGDSVTRKMAEDFLSDEEQHLDDFEGYLEGIK
jgi:bacterioferritin (cytochrome b1)